jgi:uroporphyrinogen decarboxylase
MDQNSDWHIRFRLGSFFELAWQLSGLEKFMMGFVESPAIPKYIMDRLLEVHLENLRTVRELAGDRLGMIYTYDDVATKDSLMISPKM